MSYILDQKAFHSKLRELGFQSVFDFAQKTGVHRNTINQYLNGKNIISSAFDRIAKALKVDPIELALHVPDEGATITDLDEIQPVITCLIKHDSKIAVVLLGSRARRTGREFADWDIGITRASSPIGGIEYLKLRSRVQDIADDLPCGVDFINLDAAPRWFLEEIDYKPIFLDGDRESFMFFKGVLNGIKKENAA